MARAMTTMRVRAHEADVKMAILARFIFADDIRAIIIFAFAIAAFSLRLAFAIAIITLFRFLFATYTTPRLAPTRQFFSHAR
jgi:hypothetical protein